jgi:stearoyl-CoA desaturase (delta-9 desaturase)
MWGEGWHNNHHRFQSRPNIGERWYEIDIGYYLIKLIKNENL